MGGYCALALARRAPERVRGLLLVGARPDADTEERRTGRGETIQLIRNEGVDGLWRMVMPKLFHDQSVANKQLVYRDADALVTALEAVRDRPDSTDVARAFPAPVQFVVGEFDPYVSAAELEDSEVRGCKVLAPSRTSSGRTSSTRSCASSSTASSFRPSSTSPGSKASSVRTTCSSGTCAGPTHMHGGTSPARGRSFWAPRRR